MDTDEECKIILEEILSKIEESCDAESESLKDHETKAVEDIATWLANDHGTFLDVEEKDYFDICNASTNVVVLFYGYHSRKCTIIDHHLRVLSRKHLETRFIRVNREKAPYLRVHLRILSVPTVILIKKKNIAGRIFGLSDFGSMLHFPTELMEWKIAQSEVITYDGDLNIPPIVDHKSIRTAKKRPFQDSDDDESDD